MPDQHHAGVDDRRSKYKASPPPASTLERAREALLRLDDYRHLVEVGVGLIEQGKAVQAAARLTEALTLHGNDAETLTARATAYSILGDLDRARADLDRALELHSSFRPALARRGLIRLKLGDLEGALSDLDHAIEAGPSARLHLDRGTVRQAMSDAAGASADYSRAIEIEPGDPRAWAARGLLLYAANDRLGAVSDLRSALRAAHPIERPLLRGVLHALGRLAIEGYLDRRDLDALAAAHDAVAVRRSRVERSLTLSSGAHRRLRFQRSRRALLVATAVGALLVIALVLWPGTTSEAEFAREGQEAVPESMTLEPRDRVDLEAAIRTAITCVEAGEIPASPEDAEIYDGMDYDDLVSLGVFTREEAKLQRELDTAFIARSTQLDSTKERRKEDDR